MLDIKLVAASWMFVLLLHLLAIRLFPQERLQESVCMNGDMTVGRKLRSRLSTKISIL